MDPHLAGTIRRVAIAGVPALVAGTLALLALGGFSGSWATSDRWGAALASVIVALVCSVVYGLVMAALRAPEIRLATDLVRSRIRRS